MELLLEQWSNGVYDLFALNMHDVILKTAVLV